MNKIQWNLNRSVIIFTQENVFENDVSKMTAILSRPWNVYNVHVASFIICHFTNWQHEHLLFYMTRLTFHSSQTSSLGSKTANLLTRSAVKIAVNKTDIWRVRYHYSCDRFTIVWSLWRNQQSIVTPPAERKPSEWDTGMMCKDRRFYCHIWIRYIGD